MHRRILAASSLIAICGILLAGCGGGGGDGSGGGGGADSNISATLSNTCNTATECLTAQHVSIANYRGNRSAAVSYTFDDGSPKCDQIIQMFDAQEFKASFYVIAKKTTTAQWSQWLAASREGHEIGSHSSTHAYLFDPKLTDAQLYDEIVESQQIIADHIGVKPDIFSFPGNAYDERSLALVKQYYLATRFPVELNGPDYSVVSIGTPTSAATMNAVLDAAVSGGKWTAFAGHSIDGAGYNPINSSVLRENLSYAATRQDVLWVDTFSNVARYKQCRESARITTSALSDAEGAIELTTDKPALCNFPMTVVLRNVNLAGTRTILANQPVIKVSNQVLIDLLPNQPAKISFQ